ncbi:MAG: hypothetical protein ACM3L6_03710 [Deltaproteobacteria bacterium]
MIARLNVPVFFCLCAALAAPAFLAAEPGGTPQASAGAGTAARAGMDVDDPRIKSTGREWLALEAPDKFAAMRTLFSFYGLDEEAYDVARAVELLDLMYSSRAQALTDGVEKNAARERLERDALLNSPARLNFMYILNDKDSPYGVRYFRKEGAGEQGGVLGGDPLRKGEDKV